MTINKLAVLSRLDSSDGPAAGDIARAFLMDEETHPVSEEPVRVRTSEALSVWRVRLKNSLRTGHHIEGAERLISRLEAAAPTGDLEQIGFLSPSRAGLFFFEVESGDFAGFAIADRPQAPEGAPYI